MTRDHRSARSLRAGIVGREEGAAEISRGGEKRGDSEPIYLPGASLFMNLLFYERKSAIRHHLSTPPPLFPFSLFMNLLAELPFTTRGRCTRKSDCASSPLRGSSDNLLRIRLRVEDTLYR